ncbi:MAG: hypothetical protein K1X67_03290 [Fimbriimonadaceae bacterium]|nr:hypothetical protein [Fimbriimonadaceae bacterium]
MTNVIAPTTETYGESFLWYGPVKRVQLGLAFLWRQKAFRFLGTYQFLTETPKTPSFTAGFGVQGIGTGNPGYFVTSEKNFPLGSGRATAYLGVGFRANESHGHMLGGFKFSPDDDWTLGIQFDGHAKHPFVTRRIAGGFTLGAYLIDAKSPALLFSVQY